MKRLLREYQWHLLAIFWGAAVWLGIAGFARYAAMHGMPNTFWDNLYLTLQLIPMNSGAVLGPLSWELEIARLAIPALAAYTAIRAFALLFDDQIRRLRLSFTHGHTVICGLSRKGQLLAERLASSGNPVVVIEKDGNHPALSTCREAGIPVLIGDATIDRILQRAGILRAAHLLAVCDQDGVNAAIALHAQQICRKASGVNLTCTVHIMEPQMYELLREAEFSGHDGPSFRLELFNVYERGAKRLAHTNPLIDRSQNPVDRPPHVLIVGLGRLGENLLIQLARRWHCDGMATNGHLRVTVVDRAAGSKVEHLCIRYPQMNGVCDITALPIEMSSPEFQRAAFLHDPEGNVAVDWVYVCLDSDTLGLQSALVLRQRMGSGGIPIVVRMAESRGLADLMTGDTTRPGRLGPLQAFNLLDWACTPEWVLGGTYATLAHALHAEYIRQLATSGEHAQASSAAVPWEELPRWRQDANMLQAGRLAGHLNQIGYSISPRFQWDPPPFSFTPEEVEALSQMEHAGWVDAMRRQGWRYAPGDRDSQTKTHPDLVTWTDLPEAEKEKNRHTVRQLPAILGRADFQIERCT